MDNYKEEFLNIAKQGYEDTQDALVLKVKIVNPYDYVSEHYAHQAWETGSWWYMSMVH